MWEIRDIYLHKFLNSLKSNLSLLSASRSLKVWRDDKLTRRLDYDCRWGKVDVVGDLVDVLHGGAPEGKLHLPLGQEPVPIFVDGLESGLSLENEISVF